MAIGDTFTIARSQVHLLEHRHVQLMAFARAHRVPCPYQRPKWRPPVPDDELTMMVMQSRDGYVEVTND